MLGRNGQQFVHGLAQPLDASRVGAQGEQPLVDVIGHLLGRPVRKRPYSRDRLLHRGESSLQLPPGGPVRFGDLQRLLGSATIGNRP